MKLGIVGTGQVGCAIALAAATRGSAREIVLVNRTRKTAAAVATDMRCGTPLCPKVDIKDADYDGLAGSEVILITSGVNEKTGGAIPALSAEERTALEKSAQTLREALESVRKRPRCYPPPLVARAGEGREGALYQ